jgi:hypothetical protein
MVPILALWLPILVSAVLVFVGSSVLHMVLGYHKSDYSRVDSEDEVMDALRPANLAPGDYFLPHADSTEVMKSPVYQKKLQEGPVAFMTVADPSAFSSMGRSLRQWFAYSVLIAAIVAYATGRVLAPGAEYLTVFRLAGTVTFCCYALGEPIHSIWFHRKWSTTFKTMFDGLIYACLTGGAFGWLWPE